MIFCECDYAELLSKGIIKEWPGTQKLVQALWRDDYQNGYSILKQIKAETGSVGMAMEQELRFLYPTGCSRKDWHNLWRDQKESLRLLCTVWCLTSQYAGAFGKNWLGKACRDLSEMTKKGTPQEETPRELSKSKAEMQDKAGKTFTSSHEQGAFLENAVMKLLNHLFHLPQESIADLEMQVSSVLEVLRRQNSGAQGGHDIRIVYLDETGKKRVCLFECKNKRVTKIKIADIVEKLELVKLAGQEVEHWILVAPCAKLANDAVSYLERLERHPGGQLPIKNVQVWGEDNGVKELFGLVPELYHAIYGGDPGDEDAPEQWTNFQRTQIREHWGQKLLPVASMPCPKERCCGKNSTGMLSG